MNGEGPEQGNQDYGRQGGGDFGPRNDYGRQRFFRRRRGGGRDRRGYGGGGGYRDDYDNFRRGPDEGGGGEGQGDPAAEEPRPTGPLLRLDDLQKMSFQELADKATEAGVENPGGLRKYELIFEILRRHALENGRVAGEGFWKFSRITTAFFVCNRTTIWPRGRIFMSTQV